MARRSNLGNTLMMLARRGEAVAAFRQTLVINPKHVDAYQSLGMTLYESGERDAAAEARSAIGFEVKMRGRYAHTPDYLRETLKESGLSIRSLSRSTLRMEAGQAVEGIVVVAKGSKGPTRNELPFL